MSADLVWRLVKKNSSFLVRRNGVEFSSEKGNLTNLNTRKSSGLVYRETVDISSAENGRGVTLTTKKINGPLSRKVSKRSVAATFSRGPRHIGAAVVSRIGGYRPDLRRAALSRTSAILKSQRKRKTPFKRTRGIRAQKNKVVKKE